MDSSAKNSVTSGLFYKHATIVIYNASGVSKSFFYMLWH